MPLPSLFNLVRKNADASVAEIKTDTDRIPANPASDIRSIQRQSVSPTPSTTHVFNLATTLIDPAKCVIQILGGYSSNNENPFNVRFDSLSTTQITFTTPDNVRTFSYAFQIIEYY